MANGCNVERDIFPDACGKGLVAITNKGIEVIGFTIQPLYPLLNCLKKYYGAFIGDLSDEDSPQEITRCIEMAILRGESINSSIRQEASDYFHNLFLSQVQIGTNILVDNGSEAYFELHAKIAENQIESKYGHSPEKVKYNGGFFYIAPIVRSKTVLALFGESKKFGGLENLNEWNDKIAKHFGFLTPKQYEIRAK